MYTFFFSFYLCFCQSHFLSDIFSVSAILLSCLSPLFSLFISLFIFRPLHSLSFFLYPRVLIFFSTSLYSLSLSLSIGHLSFCPSFIFLYSLLFSVGHFSLILFLFFQLQTTLELGLRWGGGGGGKSGIFEACEKVWSTPLNTLWVDNCTTFGLRFDT